MDRQKGIRFGLAFAALGPLLGACGNFAPGRAVEVGTGLVSHQLCSAVFVSGLDPQEFYREAVAPMVWPAGFLLSHQINRESAEVTATFAGLVHSRAIYRAPLGCVLVHGAPPQPVATGAGRATASLLPPIASHEVVPPADPAMKSALDRAFEEPERAPHRWTKAVVVVHDGHVLAERYAPGYGVDTPVAGWSASKSVINALIGILVQQGQLKVTEPAPVAAWAGSSDPRHAIRVGGVRILPQGWVDYSATQTRGSEVFGYGAGFWTNRGDGAGARRRVAGGMRADSFMARGNLGQYVVIVPSKRLVIARFANSQMPRGDIDMMNRLVADVVAAVTDL